jgi:hypothetical protein
VWATKNWAAVKKSRGYEEIRSKVKEGGPRTERFGEIMAELVLQI